MKNVIRKINVVKQSSQTVLFAIVIFKSYHKRKNIKTSTKFKEEDAHINHFDVLIVRI